MPPAPLFSRPRPSLGAHSIRDALLHVGIEGRPGGETLRLGIHVAVCGRILLALLHEAIESGASELLLSRRAVLPTCGSACLLLGEDLTWLTSAITSVFDPKRKSCLPEPNYRLIAPRGDRRLERWSAGEARR